MCHPCLGALHLPSSSWYHGPDPGSAVDFRELHPPVEAELSSNPSRHGIFCNITSCARGDRRLARLSGVAAVWDPALRHFTRSATLPGGKTAPLSDPHWRGLWHLLGRWCPDRAHPGASVGQRPCDCGASACSHALCTH